MVDGSTVGVATGAARSAAPHPEYDYIRSQSCYVSEEKCIREPL